MIDLRKLAEPGSIEETLLEKIDLKRLPRHIAVIMDGNGRWARARSLPRVEGHRAGIAAVRETVETAARLELRVITLYAFSVENWKRPRYEVATLMMLLKEYLRKELARLMENDIRFTPIARPEPRARAPLRRERDEEQQRAALPDRPQLRRARRDRRHLQPHHGPAAGEGEERRAERQRLFLRPPLHRHGRRPHHAC